MLKIYFNALPIFLMPSIMLGLATGMNSSLELQQEKKTSIDFFVNIIGFTGVGIMTGFLYPISFPICGSYVIYRHITKK